jgi:hypothetical protein
LIAEKGFGPMRFSATATLFAALALAGCMGPEGNPDRSPYANDPGGAMAVKPETVGKVAYDPYATPKPFSDMQAGQAAINPPPPGPLPTPMPMATPGRPRY